MSAVGDPFTASDIRTIARDPQINLASLRSGSGYSYPERSWIYSAATAYYEAGRSPAALWARLDEDLARGKGLTPSKSRRAEGVRIHLQTFIELDRTADAPFLITAKTSPDVVTSWRDHQIRLPMGLILRGTNGPFMRLLWAEQALMHGKRGVGMVLAATLAAAEATHGSLAGIETWHLRERGHVPKSYGSADLRASWSRLDRLLRAVEARLRQAPFA